MISTVSNQSYHTVIVTSLDKDNLQNTKHRPGLVLIVQEYQSVSSLYRYQHVI